MRSDSALECLARTHLWDVPLPRALALLRGIERETTESLSDQRLVEMAESAVRGKPARSAGSPPRHGGRAWGFR
jgi:hypothetical protein